jgi:hypothetical protein
MMNLQMFHHMKYIGVTQVTFAEITVIKDSKYVFVFKSKTGFGWYNNCNGEGQLWFTTDLEYFWRYGLTLELRELLGDMPVYIEPLHKVWSYTYDVA